jgi:nucleoside-diphosphate-sugar epimerase
MRKHYLITGGEGFIGRNLKKFLIQNSNTVKTLDINGNPDYLISVTDFDKIMDIKEEFDGIFHLAATTSPPEFDENPLSGFNVNANGTLNVLEFARIKNIPRVILASSSATYGNSKSVSIENELPDRYSNLYPVTKILDEYLARFYSIRKDVECISLRYFNTYGPGENSKSQYASVIWRFIKSFHKHERPVIYGDGEQRRDFIYIDDNVKGTYLAMEKGIPGESYNIGSGDSNTFNRIYEIVKEMMNSDLMADYIKNPLKSYQFFTQADMSKAKEDLGFVPEYDIAAGVKKMVSYGVDAL